LHVSGSAPARRVRFVRDAVEAREPGVDDLTIVLDTSWTPLATDRADVRPIRSYVATVVEGHDLFAESLGLLDAWAKASSVAHIVSVEGTTYWFRLREELWHWTQERLLWRYVLAAVDAGGSVHQALIPGTEAALLDVAHAIGWVADGGADPSVERSVGPQSAGRISRFVPAPVRRAIRRVFPRPETIQATVRARRHQVLDDRIRGLQTNGKPVVLVLSAANLYQPIGTPTADSPSRRDPNLGSVIDAIGPAGMQPIVVGGTLDVTHPADWDMVEHDTHLLSWDYVQSRWGAAADDQRAEDALEKLQDRLAQIRGFRFLLDGLDLTNAFLRAIRGLIDRIVNPDVHELAVAERMIGDLVPRAILMTHEGHRVPWLVGGASAGVPTFTVQHGILYPAHPGYANWRPPTLILPTCTFVFGDYERRALLAGAYRPDEVRVSGSPRLDVLNPTTDPERSDADRASLRAEMMVADGDLMLVVSTISLPFMQRFHFVHMLETVLSGPLPGVHLIFKQHPSEVGDGPYQALLGGLARTGGYEPPRMTVVRDVDLHRLLRAADAHLGQISTVLSDAVVDGIPNLIAIVEPGGDILGYIAAGVARPVRGAADLKRALAELTPPDADARRAFLSDHFLEGKAGERIADAIAQVVFDMAGESTVGAA